MCTIEACRQRELGASSVQHHALTGPHALGQTLREYAIAEPHLKLIAGRWQYDRWDLPDQPSVAPGAELRALMGDGWLDEVRLPLARCGYLY